MSAHFTVIAASVIEAVIGFAMRPALIIGHGHHGHDIDTGHRFIMRRQREDVLNRRQQYRKNQQPSDRLSRVCRHNQDNRCFCQFVNRHKTHDESAGPPK